MGACLVALVAVTGCGGGLGKLHPVTGKVTGEFKEGDKLVFTKTGGKGNQGLEIQGEIKADGSYTMKTSSGKTIKDGVPEGTYTVSVTSSPAAAGGDPAAMAGGAGGPAAGAGGPPPALKASPDETKVPGGPFDFTLSK